MSEYTRGPASSTSLTLRELRALMATLRGRPEMERWLHHVRNRHVWAAGDWARNPAHTEWLVALLAARTRSSKRG